MTDIKKTARNNTTARSKKLHLNKETLKDLGGSKAAQVRGGQPTNGPALCTKAASGCGN